MDKLKKILALLIISQTISCQKKMENLPTWESSMCQPYCYPSTPDKNKYVIELVRDEIFTLEKHHAGMPYGGSSGRWGDSGKSWTSQHGTPIGADITYYAGYEDTFYRLKADFPVETIKKAVKEIHYSTESDMYDEFQDKPGGGKIGSFDGLVFGFAPQGMVVVWLGYGAYQVELGRYQATVVKEDKELEKKLFASWAMNREQVKELYYYSDASCALWDLYRKRYTIKVETVSENKRFKLFEYGMENYNGEYLFEFRPEIVTPKYKNRGLFKKINIEWETGINQKFSGDIFFNEKIIFEKLKDAKPTENQDLKIKIAENNGSIQVFLNNEPIKVDSIQITKNDLIYKDSYK